MSQRRGDEPRIKPKEPALRAIMRSLRDIMAEPADGQKRLDRIVRQIAGVMVADVCSLYLRRQDGSMELFASEGLNASAVHSTMLSRGEGLVGRCAELNTIFNVPDASEHPFFSYRPETGEEEYHSFLAVPINRSGEVLGVLVVQNRTAKEYSDEDVEVLQSTAMVVAEHLVSGAVAGAGAALDIEKALSKVIVGERISDGIALGHAMLHQPRIVVTRITAEDPVHEQRRLEEALSALLVSLDEMLADEQLARDGEHREVLETYRMFAADKGWQRRLREAVQSGLTADAAVERVQNGTRARFLKQNDPFWRERQRDLDDLSDRLLRILAGRKPGRLHSQEMPPDTILIARNMGPAELIDYDRDRLRGLVIEDGSGQSHVAIVAKALGIAAVAQASGAVERVTEGDAVIVDAVSGEVHIRPSPDVVSAFSDKVRFRARRQQQFAALRDVPAQTKDGVSIALQMNAGLQVDMSHLDESGADGVGLFRTELMFMLSHQLPRVGQQAEAYRAVMDEANDKPVVFRTLDIGGDKILPYLPQTQEENPAIGWRAVRMSLDHPALFRIQIRALLKAGAGRELRIMLPMVAVPEEVDAARALIEKEQEIAISRGLEPPSQILIGAMIEVPSVLFELDGLLPKVDFVSVGSNDLTQFLFAADRGNARVAKRFDSLSPPPLRALKMLADATREHDVGLTLCGEMAGNPLEAMTLISLGFRTLSMAPASIGPVKTMILSLDAGAAAQNLDRLLAERPPNLRAELEDFARKNGVEI